MSVDLIEHYRPLAAAGAAWLDENEPSWVAGFVEDRGAGLHMDSCGSCVLGYVFGCFHDSPLFLDAYCRDEDSDLRIKDPDRVEEAQTRAVALGFDIAEDFDDEAPQYDALRQAWRELIEQRLAERAAQG